MKKNIVAIGVGANVNPDRNIAAARHAFARDHILLAQSSIVTTAPIGETDQPDFRNGAFLIETNLDLDTLNAYLKDLEKRSGRLPSPHKSGPRTLDLDIVVWNGKIINPDYYQRPFLKNAISQILPHLKQPT